ncbi:15882_t:CDS:1 [Acaulospora colombiana]|uniref:15882_t:CDS:1 n=1 Tax=Acaulospora colombiana TaxID=27376 RepID=A0ACA9L8S6_9GLOM|nr:15882_t:CDS:1 [Acaulospora colombiana]
MVRNAPYQSQWGGLRHKNGQPPSQEVMDILNRIDRDDIFNSTRYNSNFLFHMLLRRNNDPSKVKRPPNPFIIVRTIFGLVANDNNISIGDGTSHSALAGLIWRSATQEEKARINRVFEEIKRMHRLMYPNYRYRPEKNSMSGDRFSNKTAKDFENNIVPSTVAPDADLYSTLPLYAYPLPSPVSVSVPSIAVNCPPMPVNYCDFNEVQQQVFPSSHHFLYGSYDVFDNINTQFDPQP